VKYKRRPAVVEAFQMTEEHRGISTNWPQWLCDAWANSSNDIYSFFRENDGVFKIRTLEGLRVINVDDWIIQDAEGELYSCSSDVFEKIYEEVKNES
jgi:hypothetical protein